MAFITRVLATPVRVYNRTLRITREGWFFTGFSFAVGIAAINTGNNLMYLVLAMMMAVMVVSGILSENALRRIRIERRMPPEAWAKTPFAVEYAVFNPKRFLPSYSLRIQEKGVESAAEAFILKLSAGSRANVEGRFVRQRRGMLHFTQPRIVTQFPFGLFEKTKLVELEDSLVIFPAPLQADESDKSEAERGMEESGLIRGEGAGLFGLRDYRDGDNPRRIHWKLSARAGKLILKETEAMDLPMMAILLDTSGYRPGKDEDALEAAVSRCAGLAKNHIEKGYMVRLLTNQGEIPYGAGPMHLRRILTTLALFDPTPGPVSISPLRHGEAHVVVRGWKND